jgi:hypothetical protein
MATSVKVGWARGDYGRQRNDTEVDLADLPLILAEHGLDPAVLDGIPYGARLEMIQARAEMFSLTVRLRHEVADDRAAGKSGPGPAALAVRDARREEAARLDALLVKHAGKAPAQAREPAAV